MLADAGKLVLGPRPGPVAAVQAAVTSEVRHDRIGSGNRGPLLFDIAIAHIAPVFRKADLGRE